MLRRCLLDGISGATSTPPAAAGGLSLTIRAATLQQQRLGVSVKCTAAEHAACFPVCRYGFHSVPSLRQLHMHVVSQVGAAGPAWQQD